MWTSYSYSGAVPGGAPSVLGRCQLSASVSAVASVQTRLVGTPSLALCGTQGGGSQHRQRVALLKSELPS